MEELEEDEVVGELRTRVAVDDAVIGEGGGNRSRLFGVSPPVQYCTELYRYSTVLSEPQTHLKRGKGQSSRARWTRMKIWKISGKPVWGAVIGRMYV